VVEVGRAVGEGARERRGPEGGGGIGGEALAGSVELELHLKREGEGRGDQGIVERD
jgi:hypothetical protein